MASEVVEKLRQQMRNRFPQAHVIPEEAAQVGERREESKCLFDVEMFPVGKVSEVIPAGKFSGISLLVAGLLENDGIAESGGFRMVLVDGADGFDPESYSDEACGRLLWVRCRSALESIKAADLFLRDGNVPFVLLDLLGLGRRELKQIQSAAWWRLKQVAERRNGRLVVLARETTAPCASMRLRLGADLLLEDFDAEREELLGRLRVSTADSHGSIKSLVG